MSASNVGEFEFNKMTPEESIIRAAQKLVKAKLRWKGKPPGRRYSSGWTQAEIELFEALAEAGYGTDV